MFRLRRRYRVFLICAFVLTVLLYQVSKNSGSQWNHSQKGWHMHSRPRPPPPPPPSTSRPGPEHHGEEPAHKPPPPPPPPPHHKGGDHGRPVPNREASIKIPQLKTSDGVKGGYSLPTKAPATVPDRKPPAIHDAYGQVNENAAVHFGEPVPTSTTPPHWQKQPDWFPVPDDSIIPLPTGKPKPIPSVQFAFGDESPAAKEKRELRMAKVKAETQRAWDGYKKYAWTHDELMPVAKMFKDPFCGWAATLVDSLDTLWLMGMKPEFDEAVEAVKAIDFTTTHRDNIPVFETVIRYLGGLIGAYDVTGGHKGKYRVLLDKAVELAEILMSVFDTPNRMPILYYDWKPAGNIQPKRASTSSGVAELGSLSMEFTRLAQLTGENKYYDAVARITDALEDLQNREKATALPGIFPEHIDASGCNRSASLPSAPEPPTKTPGSSTAREFPPEWECAPQGLVRGGWGGGGTYSMGGSQDSTYEYFPKQYALLGGLEAKYRTMHEKVADAVKKYLLYRPMAEGNPDILFSAKAHSSDGTDQGLTYEWEVTHLTCFLGGMFGLGGKIFNRPEDVEVGKKLAEGCVWAYEIMPTGIMPESASLTPCKIPDDCLWNKTAWYERLDPSAEYRAKAMENYYVSKAEWEREVQDLKKKDVLRKQTEERKRREAAAGKVAEEEERQKRPVNNTLPGEEESIAPQPDQPSQDSSRGLKRRDALPQSEVQTRDSEDGYGDTWDQEQIDELVLPYEPVKPQTHEEYVADYIERHQIPPGFTAMNDKRYILRPEAIESVWYMYRITGDPSWQDKGWRMFEAVVKATRTEAGHTAIRDVTSSKEPETEDSMESFWLAETLKYFYLLFETPDVISLDEWVLNTEAHPFRRPS